MSRRIRFVVVACVALAGAGSVGAALPVALLGKQILKQMIIDTVKDLPSFVTVNSRR